MKDIFPDGVALSGTYSSPGGLWSCVFAAKTMTCTTSQVIASGASFTDIIVPVTVTATTGTVVNHAVVHNPAESAPCYADNRMPTGNESSCA